MTFVEFCAEFEARRGKQDGDYAGNLTRGAVEELLADMRECEARNVTSPA